MGNVIYPSQEPMQLPALDGFEIDIYDILAWDATNQWNQAADQITPGGSEAADQATLAGVFNGLAASAKRVIDTGVPVRFWTDVDLLYPCISQTFNVGDFVGGTRDGGGALVRHKVTLAPDLAHAIGRVQATYLAATTIVRVRFFSKILAPQL